MPNGLSIHRILLAGAAFVLPQLAFADLSATWTLSGVTSPAPTCTGSAGSTSCTINGPNGAVSVVGTATASAGYGSLHAAINTSSSGAFQWNIDVGAEFSDELTLIGYQGAGFVQYDFSAISTGGFFLDALEQPDVAINGSAFSWESGDQLNGPTAQSILLPFTGDEPFGVSVDFNDSLRSSSGGGDALDLGGSYTLELTGIEFYDSNGDPLSGYSLVSASGTAYPGIAEAPEASPLLLFATAICLIYIGTRTRNSLRTRDH